VLKSAETFAGLIKEEGLIPQGRHRNSGDQKHREEGRERTFTNIMSVLSEKSFDPDGMDLAQSEASYDPEGRQSLQSEKSFDPDCSDEEDEEAVLVPPPAAQSRDRDAWDDDNSSEKSFDASEESFDPDEILPPEEDEPEQRNQQALQQQPRANCTKELPVETRGQEDDEEVEELRAREAAAKSSLDVGSPTAETQTLCPQSLPLGDHDLDSTTLYTMRLTPPNPKSLHPDTSRMRCRSLEQCIPWPVLWDRLLSLISPTLPKSSPMRGRDCAWTRPQV
jgi:hypothetical protein